MRILNLKYTLDSFSWPCFLEHFGVHTSNASSFIWQLTSYQVSASLYLEEKTICTKISTFQSEKLAHLSC